MEIETSALSDRNFSSYQTSITFGKVQEPKSLARLFARGDVNGMIFLFPPGHVVNYQAALQ